MPILLGLTRAMVIREKIGMITCYECPSSGPCTCGYVKNLLLSGHIIATLFWIFHVFLDF